MYKFLAALVLVYALAIPCSEAAPAPFPRTTRPLKLTADRLVGEWKLDWCGSQWTARFCACGTYICYCGGNKFVGTWGIDGRGRLVIREAHVEVSHDLDRWAEYSIRLDPATLKGVFESGNEGRNFALER